MSYYIVKLVVFSCYSFFLIIELVLNIRSFNMVTRGNAMANKSSQSVGSKRSYSDLNRRENEPLTKNRKEAVVVPKANPWSKRAESA